MKDVIQLTAKLLIICILAAALLGATYGLTSGPIEQGKQERAKASRQAVLNEADSFEAIDVAALKASGEWVDNADMNVSVNEAYIGKLNGEKSGMTVKVTSKGYNPGIEITVGFMPDGAVEAVRIGSHQETPGLGANASDPKFLNQFAKHIPYFIIGGGSPEAASGPSTDGGNGGETVEVDALTSATLTSNGVISGINVAYDFFKSVYGKE